MKTSCWLVASKYAKQCDTKASSWPLATGQCESCILSVSTFYQRICLFWHWFNTFGVFFPQIWMYFFHLYESFFLLLGILKISTFHHCWLDICVWNSKSQIKNPQWQIFVLRFVGDIIFVKYKVNGVDGYFLYIMIWYCI